jgi:metal-dependent amidase/aminoacylase/carboxypeptidase family protein
MLANSILPAIKAYEPELVAIRRDIHAHPETGFEEVRTAALVARTLRGWGIEVHEGIEPPRVLRRPWCLSHAARAGGSAWA